MYIRQAMTTLKRATVGWGKATIGVLLTTPTHEADETEWLSAQRKVVVLEFDPESNRFAPHGLERCRQWSRRIPASTADTGMAPRANVLTIVAPDEGVADCAALRAAPLSNCLAGELKR
jgi:hypothetical protein